MKKKKDLLSEYAAALEQSFKRWEELYNYGGQDPFWEDGMGLSLVRNHILSYKRQIEEYIKNEHDSQTSMFKSSFPEIYYKETPPEIDSKYMAIPNKILDKSITFVNRIKEEPAYKYIIEHFYEVFPDKKEDAVTKQYGVPLIPAWQITSYEEIIKSGNIVELRRSFYFTDYDKKVEEINRIADKMAQVLALSNEEREAIMNKKRNKSVNDDYEYDDSEELEDVEISDSELEKSTGNPSFETLVSKAEQKKTHINECKDKDIIKTEIERI